MDWSASKKYTDFGKAESKFSGKFIPFHKLVYHIEIVFFVMIGMILFRLPIRVEENRLNHILGHIDLLAKFAKATLVVEFMVVVFCWELG